MSTGKVIPGAPEKIVLPDCPAPKHNTQRAAMGYTPGHDSMGDKPRLPRCVCPYAVWILQRVRNRSCIGQRRLARSRRTGTPLPSWWTGPWAMAADCPAERHWTYRAATKGVRCICPRALRHLEYGKARLERLNVGRVGLVPREVPVSLPLPSSMPASAEFRRTMPDLSAGACQRRENTLKVEMGEDRSASIIGIYQRELAKEVCTSCPLSTARACREWVLRYERPHGSWSGVIGGLDPWERSGRRLVHTEGGRVEAVRIKIGEANAFA